MRKIVISILAIFLTSLFTFAQTTGSISGTVTDINGALVPNATVNVKGEGGQEFTVTTSDSGIYRIPAVAAGFYTVRITASNFKSVVINNVKVDVGVPSTANAALEAGNVSEVVEVSSGGEVLQTQTSTIGTNIQGRQITEQPIQSRDALDLVVNLPGTNTIGTVRTSTINGLPKEALSVSIDGIDANTSLLRASDGFFTFVRPRIDAIDEVTVSTSNPGADASGDSAAQIRFVTRRGTDDYRGGLYWQHRNTALNANYWLNNRDGLPRQKIQLNQFGGKFGGPIPFLDFGEGGPIFDSGKGKRYFFFNYEEYRIPESSPPRARTILDTQAQAGIFQYLDGATTRTVDVLALAAAANKGYVGTVDPTIASVLNRIRQSTTVRGVITPITGDVNRERFTFTNPSNSVRKFLAVRMDFNLTKNHSLETVLNKQEFRSDFDTLNGLDPAFPEFTNGGAQNSDRRMFVAALRSNFGQNVVNEFRAGKLWGVSGFTQVGGSEFFTDMFGGNRTLNLNVTNLGTGGTTTNPLTNATIRNTGQIRAEPTYDFTDNLTWLRGNHTLTFGGQYKIIKLEDDNRPAFVPTVGFAVASSDPILSDVFTAANFPGASATIRNEAAALYALLTGRVASWTENAQLGADGQYVPSGPSYREVRQITYGFYGQDSWKIRPNLTLTYGLRWQPQEGFTLLSENYARLTNFEMIYDVSGTGNIFSPGTLTGVVPTATGTKSGEKSYATDYNNFAPSVGVVWSPEVGESGIWNTLFGGPGKSVIRGGFARSFIREGINIAATVLTGNPGSAVSASRSVALGNIAIGSLLRTPNNPNLTPATFVSSPTYPLTLTSADSAYAFDPNLKTGYVDSWSVGFQRELDKNTVIEVRYVANRGKDIVRLKTISELNAIENGFAQEYLNAQNNLYLNKAAGKGNTFAYFSDVVGSSQLPIFQSFYAGNRNSLTYSSTQYTNATNINALSKNNANVLGLVGTLNTDATRRNNAYVLDKRPANFLINCPTTLGFCFMMENGEKTWYDSAVFEVRRRLSNGLRLQASYVYAKAFSNGFPSQINTGGFGAIAAATNDQNNGATVTLRNPDLDKGYAQTDIRHAFKFDATYDLPFGRGRELFTNANWFTNALVGGWSILPTLRWQSGSPFLLENVQLVGMTVKELQQSVGVYKKASVVRYLPDDIITNTIAAFNVDVTSATGYSSANGVPTGRFIAPAGYGNCQARYPGECGFRRLVLYGPGFFKLDASLGKKIIIDEKRNVELRATFFDVLNRTNWRVGGWTGNFTNVTNMNAATFGELGANTAFQDPFGSNDPGGRIIDLTLRINF
jgi:hypothetical protein